MKYFGNLLQKCKEKKRKIKTKIYTKSKIEQNRIEQRGDSNKPMRQPSLSSFNVCEMAEKQMIKIQRIMRCGI